MDSHALGVVCSTRHSCQHIVQRNRTKTPSEVTSVPIGVPGWWQTGHRGGASVSRVTERRYAKRQTGDSSGGRKKGPSSEAEAQQKRPSQRMCRDGQIGKIAIRRSTFERGGTVARARPNPCPRVAKRSAPAQSWSRYQRYYPRGAPSDFLHLLENCSRQSPAC